ncbi:hypothetical protein PFL02_40350 [Pseudomonas fluorescens]|nr:hypothetical protein PFL02_40350 [Pseudomonas fluorescens]
MQLPLAYRFQQRAIAGHDHPRSEQAGGDQAAFEKTLELHENLPFRLMKGKYGDGPGYSEIKYNHANQWQSGW